jgi:hypothetical protein
MANDTVDTMLAGAKKTLAEAESKFPSSQAPTPAKPSYTAAREERKSPTIGDELSEKARMVQNAKKALNQ